MGGDILDWICEHILPWVLILAMVAMGVLIPVGCYAWWQSSKSPTMTLTKSDWACTQNQTIPITTYVQSGKVMIPVTTYVQQCNQWNRQ